MVGGGVEVAEDQSGDAPVDRCRNLPIIEKTSYFATQHILLLQRILGKWPLAVHKPVRHLYPDTCHVALIRKMANWFLDGKWPLPEDPLQQQDVLGGKR